MTRQNYPPLPIAILCLFQIASYVLAVVTSLTTFSNSNTIETVGVWLFLLGWSALGAWTLTHLWLMKRWAAHMQLGLLSMSILVVYSDDPLHLSVVGVKILMMYVILKYIHRMD